MKEHMTGEWRKLNECLNGYVKGGRRDLIHARTAPPSISPFNFHRNPYRANYQNTSCYSLINDFFLLSCLAVDRRQKGTSHLISSEGRYV
jgi:hypothetical protein